MNIHTEKNGDGIRLILSGELTIYVVNDVKPQLLAVLKQSETVELDLAEINEIDSAGLQLLLLAKQEARHLHCDLRLIHHSAAVLNIVELYNLAAYFGDPLFMATAEQRPPLRSQV